MEYFFVYILRCCDNTYYVGHTDNLEQRIAQHNSGLMAGFTSKRLPVKLVFVQKFQFRDEAFEVEHRVKKWSRKKKEALIRGEFDQLSELCKKRFI